VFGQKSLISLGWQDFEEKFTLSLKMWVEVAPHPSKDTFLGERKVQNQILIDP
jgi:hypothetical protein